ncbi:hypothetical protein QEZ54_20580 [Catellatospora sp. KI3]|uniref:hypothetical protein n=1 Tax=Catellatospora sp. KI3 TaxID=3041620 RepID=UPI002482435F|nr:hypothetical protein [Catellatospora sp. KI3]MDI1463381.1 hypothetical protein [Catellatospora sp. KI3]
MGWLMSSGADKLERCSDRDGFSVLVAPHGYYLLKQGVQLCVRAPYLADDRELHGVLAPNGDGVCVRKASGHVREESFI